EAARIDADQEILPHPEGAVAVAQEHADASSIKVTGNQVELAVAVDIAARQGARAGTGEEVLLGGEGAVTVAQEHAQGTSRGVARSQVQAAVTVEIGHADA